MKNGDKYHTRIKTEEHISVVKEPESAYWGHVTPVNGKAKSISNSIQNFWGEKKDSSDDILEEREGRLLGWQKVTSLFQLRRKDVTCNTR